MYIPITIKFKIQESMVVGAVLSTHLLTNSNINYYWIVNEGALAIIGVCVAMLFNLYTPDLEEEFEVNRERIEQQYRTILSDMAGSLIVREFPSDEKEKHVPVKEEIYQAAFQEMFDTINKDINNLTSIK